MLSVDDITKLGNAILFMTFHEDLAFFAGGDMLPPQESPGITPGVEGDQFNLVLVHRPSSPAEEDG